MVAVSATVGLLTRPPAANDPLGPLDLLVPPLVVAAVAAVGSRLFFAVLRRARTAARPPTRRSVVTWLARRRLQAPDRGREAATTIAATGLAMLVFSLASLASLHVTVADRAAQAAGAETVNRVESSTRLDPGVAQKAVEPEDGTPLSFRDFPVARNPALPQGQSTVWRTTTSIATSEEVVNLLVVDPDRFAASASWGSPGGPVAAGRALLPGLAEADAATAAATRRDGISAPVPVLLVGAVGDLDLEVGSTVTIDTLNDPVRLQVQGLVGAFPGAGTGPPTLVVPADSFFAAQGNDDPRLRPAPGGPRNPQIEFQTYLWSALRVRRGRDAREPRAPPRADRHPRRGARDAGLRGRGPGPAVPDRPRHRLRRRRAVGRGARRHPVGAALTGRRPDAGVDRCRAALPRLGPGPSRSRWCWR